jgi:hypothetical protein
VTLVTRGDAIMEKSFRMANKQLTNMQLMKRPRYTIEPLMEKKLDEMFRTVIRPRLTLLQSETIVANDLK